MKPARVRAHHAGFTLLEAVVTLVVVSMLVAMLMQALGQALGLRTRMLRLQGESRAMLLQEAWFRETVGGAQPPGLGSEDVFDGTVDALRYVSAVPLMTRGSASVRWWVAPDASGGPALHYSDPGVADMVVVPGPLRDVVFSYRGMDGEWRTQWRGSGIGELSAGAIDAQMLPRLVRFQALTGQGRSLDWMVFLPSDLRAQDRVDPFADKAENEL